MIDEVFVLFLLCPYQSNTTCSYPAPMACAKHSPCPQMLLLTPLRHNTCSTKCPTQRHHFSFYNSIMRACIEKGAPHKALSQFKAFLLFPPFRPDRRTFALALAACLCSFNLSAAMEAHAVLFKRGFQHDSWIAIRLFHLYLKHDRLVEAMLLLDQVFNEAVDAVHGNLMIKKLLKRGDFEEANRVFRRMPVKDLVSWNSMIAGCVQSSQPKVALNFFERMICAGLEPDGFSFSSVLSACARVGARGYGEKVHRLMLGKRIELNYILRSALIDMYAKCGSIDEAKAVFNVSKREHVSIWNSMITGLAIHGQGSDAVELFSQMEAEGSAPDGVTFLAVITACSHAGIVEEARAHFELMKNEHGIEPGIEHYGAMIDAAARAGQLDRAYETIQQMPIEPDGIIWRILLSASKRHSRADLAEKAIARMATRGSGDYVMLSSIYSSARDWNRAAQVWDSMKENRVRKKRGMSWTEVGGEVHQFKAGDRSHRETQEIYRVLNGLAKRLRMEGFQPRIELVSMDVLEGEREENVNVHSEKLAVAYCVLKSGPDAEIRVSKNLQTCEDCHEWMKLVSKVLQRVILVRDRVRFHRFEKGTCSCKDYW